MISVERWRSIENVGMENLPISEGSISSNFCFVDYILAFYLENILKLCILGIQNWAKSWERMGGIPNLKEWGGGLICKINAIDSYVFTVNICMRNWITYDWQTIISELAWVEGGGVICAPLPDIRITRIKHKHRRINS